mgnify:CR=1 FL=1
MLTFGAPLYSREFNDLKFPDELTLAGTDTKLLLNGAGMRTRFIFDIYIGALYNGISSKNM